MKQIIDNKKYFKKFFTLFSALLRKNKLFSKIFHHFFNFFKKISVFLEKFKNF
jgi:hypothetical protein